MARIGLARPGKLAPPIERQIERLNAAACSHIVTSGDIEDAIGRLEPGDSLWVTSPDRLAGSLAELLELTQRFECMGCGFCCTDSPIESRSPEGRSMLTAYTELESVMRRERQWAGVIKAKARGAYVGRQTTKFDYEEEGSPMKQSRSVPPGVAREGGPAFEGEGSTSRAIRFWRVRIGSASVTSEPT
jgi:DNA invertase Pin-like site-specific DNA recombinase